MRGFNNTITGRKHKYGFGGKEENGEFGLATLDFGARNYDPAIGRWFVLDALADQPEQIFRSPYQFAWNNPIYYNDPDGNCPSCIWGALIGGAVEYGSQVVSNYINDPNSGLDAFTNVDGGKIFIAVGTGALTGGLSALKVIGATAKVYQATAMTATVAAGNIVQQGVIDKNKTVKASELAIEIISDKLPIPKIKAPQVAEVSENIIKSAESKVKRAKNIAGDNPRPSRANALREANENLANKEAKQQAAQSNNEKLEELPNLLDSFSKEGFNQILLQGFQKL